MKRRELLQGVGIAAGSLAAAPLIACAKNPEEPAEVTPTDVLVVGGGTAGAIAAIAAARAGAKVTLVEMVSQLGGTTTTGGVNFPGLFHAWGGKQVIAGIGWEMVTKCVELGNETLPDFSKFDFKRHPQSQVLVNPYIYAALLEEAVLAAGVDLHYYLTPKKVTATDDGWKVACYGKNTELVFQCKQLIDCTGDANVVGLAGLKRLREKIIQPGSLVYKLTGQRPATQRHIPGADSSTATTWTAANIAGRKEMLRRLRLARANPKSKNTTVEYCAPETAVRETYRIDGETLITADDFVTGRVFPDSLAYSFYPIDLHRDKDPISRPMNLKEEEGALPTIPLGALIPRGAKNLLAAGRCISSDRYANSALRVQASCMAMGQVAGVSAALAAKEGETPKNLPLAAIKKVLLEQKAIVPGEKGA